MDPGPDDSPEDHVARLDAARREFDAQAQRFEQARARLEATVEAIEKDRSRPEILHDSAYARLLARLDSMPVVEQAKGILMAQHRCGPDEAFDLLRRASQRANVKVSVLAARMVEQVAAPEPGGSPPPARPTGR
jgi:predicted Rossmann fold nucleotide-binding protein DprA/Smf involved in DNA uptake